MATVWRAGRVMAALVYNNTPTRDTGELVNLTDMWMTDTAHNAKRPANWKRKDGAGFISFPADAVNMPVGHIDRTDKGKAFIAFMAQTLKALIGFRGGG